MILNGAFNWAVLWPEDKPSMIDRVTDSQMVFYWARRWPEDKHLFPPILVTKDTHMTCNCNSVTVKIKKDYPEVILPIQAYKGDAGVDLYANFQDTKSVTIDPGDWLLIPTGIRLDIPQGWEAQIRPRSGMAKNYAITVLNSPGTIDSGYTGPVGVILINHGIITFDVNNGDRIAQMVIAEVPTVIFEETDSLSKSARGESGFGSTGQ